MKSVVDDSGRWPNKGVFGAIDAMYPDVKFVSYHYIIVLSRLILILFHFESNMSWQRKWKM